jgi:hypothetical protein
MKYYTIKVPVRELSQSYMYIPLHVLLRAVYGQTLAKSQGTRKAHWRCFYPADHTQRHAEEFWHVHNFLRAPCNFRFAVSPQRTCTKKKRYPCHLLAHVTSLKWGMRGEKWHRNNYWTRTWLQHSTCFPLVKYVWSDLRIVILWLCNACHTLIFILLIDI